MQILLFYDKLGNDSFHSHFQYVIHYYFMI